MYEKPLVPQDAVARARPLGLIPFGFGPRFFVAFVLGLAWLVPAWWFRNVSLPCSSGTSCFCVFGDGI